MSTNRSIGVDAPSKYHCAYLVGKDRGSLDVYSGSHFSDPAHLRADDFGAYFNSR